MMQIYLLRHGIAEEAKPGSRDADRALTLDGKKKLREVLRAARKAEVLPSLIMTSPYRRAVETSELAAEVLGYKDELYRTPALVPMGEPEGVWEEIRAHKGQEQVLIAGHEPLLSLTLGYLLGAPELQVDFKKGALARVDVESFGSRPRGALRWLLVPKLCGV